MSNNIQNKNEKVNHFDNNFSPYRKKYIYQYEDNLFGEKLWGTSNSYLTNNKIERAILGKAVFGYFITHSTLILGLDIDDHRNLGDAYLLNVYGQVIKRLGLNPSILYRSPRGMHVYYFFSQFAPTEIIIEQAKKLLANLPVEVRPSQNEAIRIPEESKAINPENMQFINLPFEAYIGSCIKYHPAELFGAKILPESIKASLREKRQTIKKFKAIPKLEKIENGLMPFVNHNTNETFLKLCNVYRCAGLDQDETFYRFSLCLLKSPLYSGDLLHHTVLKRRIKSEYKKNSGYTPKPKYTTKNLFADIIADNVIALYKQKYLTPQMNYRQIAGITKRCVSLKEFIIELIRWIDYQDRIFANPKELALWDYLYQFYRKNRREGLYPLPKSLLRKWDGDYNDIIDFLKSITFLTPSEYQYNPTMNICKYYKVDLTKFTN